MTRPGLMASGLLTTADVAAAFRVDQRTVREWVKAGWIRSVRTPGGRFRYRHAEIEALLNSTQVVYGRGMS